MARIHCRDDREPADHDRVFVAENGWVAVSGTGTGPAVFPPDRVRKVTGEDDIYYDAVVLTEEMGSKHVDEEGRVLQEPELVRRMVVELEID